MNISSRKNDFNDMFGNINWNDANACKAYLDKHPLIEPSYDVQTAQGEEVSRKKIALRIR